MNKVNVELIFLLNHSFLSCHRVDVLNLMIIQTNLLDRCSRTASWSFFFKAVTTSEKA